MPRNHRLPLAALLSALLLSACAETHDLPIPFAAHVVEDTALSELSGLARGAGAELWAINDSGSLPRLYRLDGDGADLGRVALHGVYLRDSEDLAVLEEDGRRWLLIGDIGDNRAARGEVTVHAVAEPGDGAEHAEIAWSVTFRYPDGARDAEAMAVDTRDGSLLVLSKREPRPALYRVSLAERDAAEPRMAERLALLPRGALSAPVTGMDLSPDGRCLAVLTYAGLHVWERAPDESWAEVLARPARDLPMPRLAKAEGVSFAADADTLWVGSEKLPAVLVALPAGPQSAAR